MDAQYSFCRIGTTVGEDLRCQRCDNERLDELARVWEWSGNRKAPNTPSHRFENHHLYAKSDEHGLYLPSRGGKWRLIREPLLAMTKKYNRSDDSDTEIKFLCKSCKITEQNQVYRENRKQGQVKASVRKRVLERDDYRCRSCGEVEDKLQVDHITAVAGGGDGALGNLQALCGGCHVQKTLQEDKRWGGTGCPWERLWDPVGIRALRLPYFEVEAQPGSVMGRECISFIFSHHKLDLRYEIIPSVPIPHGPEGFRDLSLYCHGGEPDDTSFCKSERNTQAGFQKLRSNILRWA